MNTAMPVPCSFSAIQGKNPALAKKVKEQHYFLTVEDCEALEKIDRHTQVLVRCGGGRFTCAVQSVKHFIHIINEHRKEVYNDDIMKGGDYVRDVSLPM